MNLTAVFFSKKLFNIEKLHHEMRIVYLAEKKPKKIIRLDPIDPEDINIDIATVRSANKLGAGMESIECGAV
jgi:hypothetical protein